MVLDTVTKLVMMYWQLVDSDTLPVPCVTLILWKLGRQGKSLVQWAVMQF
jgi:hypothetical protein